MKNYKFYKKTIETTGTTYFLVETGGQSILAYFDFTIKDYDAVQSIIEKVEDNRFLNKTEDPYVWGNEDVTVFANEIGVLLVDKLAMRSGQEVEPLELTHEEFITFMKDFKKFIEENS